MKYNLQSEDLQNYEKNRKERILCVLQLAGVTEAEYEIAIKESSRKGVNVVLARDIHEIFVINFNSEWLRAWDDNLDIQICLDFFSVITYITEYYCKDDTGTTAFLLDAAKQSKHLPQQQQRRCLKNVFLTHRQMGIFEAFMKIFPSMKMKSSNIPVEFVPLGKPDDISRFLVRANEEFSYPNKDLFEVEGREGLYYEKPNVIEKYLRRTEDLQEICLAQFVKMYESAKTVRESDNDKADTDDDDEDFNNTMEHYHVEESDEHNK